MIGAIPREAPDSVFHWGGSMHQAQAQTELRPLGLYWGHLLQHLHLIAHHFTRLQILERRQKESPNKLG